MKTMKGPGDLPRAVRRRRGAVQLSATAIAGWAAGARLQGRADPDAGTRGCSTSTRRRERRPIATRSAGVWREARRRDHRALDPSAGPAGRRASGLRRGLRRLRAAAGARQSEGAPGAGRSSRCMKAAKASQQSRPDAQRDLLRRARLALSLSLAAAPAGLIEAAFDELARRWKPILDAFDEAGVDVALRDPSGRGPASTAPPSRCSSSASATTRAAASSTTRRTSCCSSSTTSSFIDIYHERINAVPRQGRRVQSDRPAGRLFAATSPGWIAPGRFRSLGDGQVDFSGIFSKLAPVRLRRLGGARMGVRAQASRGRRARRRAFIASHIIRVTEKAFDDFAGARDATQAQAGAMLGLGSETQCATHERMRLGMVGGGAGRLHRRGAPHRGAARRPLRARRRRAVVGCRRRARRSARRARPRRRARATATSRRWSRAEAARADGIEVVAIVTPNHLHCAGRARVPRSRHPRDLRQAADHQRCAEAKTLRAARAPKRARSSRVTLQLHRLSDGPAGARDGRGRRARRDPRWCRSNTRRTG